MGTKMGVTERTDRWWVAPALSATGLILFVLYAFWASIAGDFFQSGPYLSPFYSPYLKPPWFPFSAAMLTAWVPACFRLTCYYYRKAYYRSLLLSPPACAVSEPSRLYTGEMRPPWRWFSILHRWFLYLSLIFLISLWIDTIRAFDFQGRFGIGIGSLIMLADVVLLSGFTFGCHALRSLAGGNLRCFSDALWGETRYCAWRCVSVLNDAHGSWAWFSLASVAFTDLYIRLCALGAITDVRLL